jgi:hypothetical protein
MGRRWVVVVGLLVSAACQKGVIGDAPGLPPNGSGNPDNPNNPSNPNDPTEAMPPPVPTPEACATAPITAGPAPLRRLTNTEYTNTIASLFAVPNAAANFPDDPLYDGYDNAGGSANITDVRADQMNDESALIAQQAVMSLASLISCPVASVDDACALAFIKTYGQKIYRRPLADDEVATLKSVWDEAAPISNTVEERFELVIEAMLMAPQFSYKVEVGDPTKPPPGAGLVQLTGYEIATRLAFFIWSSTPDDALLQSAATGKLDTKDGIKSEAQRLLADDRAKAGIANFTGQWFELSSLDMLAKDATMFPQWTPQLRDDVKSETERFFEDIIWTQHGSLKDVLTAPTTFVNADLAPIYGITSVMPSQGWVKVTLPAAERKGVLTQASFLATHAHGQVTSPVKRGLFIRNKFLCQDLPPPPNNVAIVVPTPNPHSTNRQRMQQHDSDPACYSCHQMMDPVGFGFELYDAIGQHQTTENGMPIDATGNVMGTMDIDGPFNGALALIDKLAGTQQVEQCMVTQTFRFAEGRRDTADDGCAILHLQQSFHAGNQDLLGLIVEMVQSDFFRYRPLVQ